MMVVRTENEIVKDMLELSKSMDIEPQRGMLNLIMELQRCHMRVLHEQANRIINTMSEQCAKQLEIFEKKLNNILGE